MSPASTREVRAVFIGLMIVLGLGALAPRKRQ
jgi:hypothetical protein